MNSLTETEKRELLKLIETGEPLPEKWRGRLFPGSLRTPEAGKEYRLVYDGKARREEVLAKTPAAPWQLVRQFCSERPHRDRWRNLLVWGDNLLALRELLADQQGLNRFGTRGKIKLIYIDPPFATRQDFMKDKEKAYRDKVLGAQFIEFLRQRLILLRELLADDGSIYVHLDQKKGHYIKAVLDEVFGEENFINEIVWRRSLPHNDPKKYGATHDVLFFYSKSPTYIFNPQFTGLAPSYIRSHYNQIDENKRRYQLTSLAATGPGPARRFGNRLLDPPKGNHWRYSQDKIDALMASGRIVFTKSKRPRYIRYMDEMQGPALQSIWGDIRAVNSQAIERIDYPTQKPEQLLERIIRVSSNKEDILLDCFAGSGTTAAVAEKLGRRWITMDCGKLAIYTTQKRLFSLTAAVGAPKKDDRTEPERVDDWFEHLKNAPGVFLITEKARNGECNVTLDFLNDLAGLAKKHDLIKKNAAFSLICPANKLQVPASKLEDSEEGPGAKSIKVKGVEFLISFVAEKDAPEKDKPLPTKEFSLYRAGIYDLAAIKNLPWTVPSICP